MAHKLFGFCFLLNAHALFIICGFGHPSYPNLFGADPPTIATPGRRNKPPYPGEWLEVDKRQFFGIPKIDDNDQSLQKWKSDKVDSMLCIVNAMIAMSYFGNFLDIHEENREFFNKLENPMHVQLVKAANELFKITRSNSQITHAKLQKKLRHMIKLFLDSMLHAQTKVDAEGAMISIESFAHFFYHYLPQGTWNDFNKEDMDRVDLLAASLGSFRNIGMGMTRTIVTGKIPSFDTKVMHICTEYDLLSILTSLKIQAEPEKFQKYCNDPISEGAPKPPFSCQDPQ